MKTILIADDSESVREMVKFTLESAGYNVLACEDGLEADKQFDGREIDLVVTDMHMPNLDGLGLIKSIRSKAQYQFMPILFLTTESQAEKKEDAKAAGATGWIVKPFLPEKLLATVSKVIR